MIGKIKRTSLALLLTFAMIFALAANTIKVEAQGLFIWPAEGQVTSGFRTVDRPDHHGIDIAKSGDVPVVAAASGTVSKSYYSDSYGNVVFIRHTINGTQYETVYAHLRNRAVSEGQTVSQGQFIGYMGNTGQSSGQHLHFEIHKPYWTSDKRYAVDPLQYLSTVGSPANNPYDGSFGTLTVNFPAGYGVNVYNAPNGSFKGRVYGGESYKVYKEKDGFYDIGNSTWIKAEHVIFKRYIAYINFPSGYGVNVYNAPNGSFKGRVYGGESYKVYAEKDGWYDLGNSTWVKGEHVIIIK
jgi:hypothetical protein